MSTRLRCPLAFHGWELGLSHLPSWVWIPFLIIPELILGTMCESFASCRQSNEWIEIQWGDHSGFELLFWHSYNLIKIRAIQNDSPSDIPFNKQGNSIDDGSLVHLCPLHLAGYLHNTHPPYLQHLTPFSCRLWPILAASASPLLTFGFDTEVPSSQEEY